MPHIVTGRCIGSRYTDCVAVCPVDCFCKIDDPPMLVIDPDTCIDCQLCVAECPVHAIYADDEVPEPFREWIEKNAELSSSETVISDQEDALPGAKTLEEVQADEESRGLTIDEPHGS